jgi:hypothetical protein
MLMDCQGIHTKLQDVLAGGLFAFRIRGHMAFGVKITSTILDDPRQILILSRADAVGNAPHIFDDPQNPTFVFVLPGSLTFDPVPDDLRDGVMNPTPGSIFVIDGAVLICAHDTKQHDHDPVLVNAATGGIAGTQAKGPTALYSRWRIIQKRGDREIDLLSFPAES